jgi:hypothetical protein
MQHIFKDYKYIFEPLKNQLKYKQIKNWRSACFRKKLS